MVLAIAVAGIMAHALAIAVARPLHNAYCRYCMSKDRGAGSNRSSVAATGWGAFVNYHWNWRIFWEPAPNGTGTYLDMLLSGLVLTIETAICAWIIALVFGSIVGVLRTLPSKTASWIGFAYVEFFRNMPLLVQLFLWFFVLPELLPRSVGAVAEADAQCAVLYRGDRDRAVHVGARRRATAGRHRLAAARTEAWPRPRSG